MTKKKWAGLVLFALTLQVVGSDAPARRKSRLLADVAVVIGVTAAYAMIIPPVRRGILHDWSLAEVGRNFANPVRRALDGGREDHNGFWINYVGHPLTFCALGLFLKERGYSSGSALLFTQVQNVFWEYVVEGGLWKPSGKDLISDLSGALAGIFILSPLSDLGERRLAAGDSRFGNHLLYWLNPFKKINRLLFGKKNRSCALAFSISRQRYTLSLVVQPFR